MLDWLSSFGDTISYLIEFIIAFFKNTIEIVLLVFKGYTYIYTVMLFLPIQYRLVLLALISFSVIVTILHFGG